MGFLLDRRFADMVLLNAQSDADIPGYRYMVVIWSCKRILKNIKKYMVATHLYSSYIRSLPLSKMASKNTPNTLILSFVKLSFNMSNKLQSLG